MNKIRLINLMRISLNKKKNKIQPMKAEENIISNNKMKFLNNLIIIN